MSDRELFKQLKKKKLFSTFCLACAQAWSNPMYRIPRTELRSYIESTAKMIIERKDHNTIDYFNKMKHEWNLKSIAKMI